MRRDANLQPTPRRRETNTCQTMHLDHIFIRARPGAPEAEALKAFGLTEGSPNRHPGQGTANRRFFFLISPQPQPT